MYLQLAIGLGFVLGLFTRWAGILCALIFAVAIAMVDRFGGMRGIFPSGCLVVIGLYLATYGAGRFSSIRPWGPTTCRGERRRAFQELIAMARNIEIKARIESVALLTPKVAELASEGPIEIAQDDTFFNCVTGRLKLRAFSNDAGELIFYRRVNQTGPKESFYLRSPTSSPETLRESLSLAYGQIGRVRKYRTLFLVGRTRVHLDRVEDLGHFLELEVMLVDDESPEQGIREASDLMDHLGIQPSQLIEGAYLDLLLSLAGAAAGLGAAFAGQPEELALVSRSVAAWCSVLRNVPISTGRKMKSSGLGLAIASSPSAASTIYLAVQLSEERRAFRAACRHDARAQCAHRRARKGA